MLYIHTMEYLYSHEKEKILIHATTLINHENYEGKSEKGQILLQFHSCKFSKKKSSQRQKE